MKYIFSGLLVFLFNTSLSFAACPNLPAEWDIKTASFEISRIHGDYTVTLSLPNLYNLNCTVQTGTSHVGYIFELKNSPVTLTFKNKTMNKVTQTVKMSRLLITKYTSSPSGTSTLGLREPSKKNIDPIFYDPYVLVENGKYISHESIAANGSDLKILTRW